MHDLKGRLELVDDAGDQRVHFQVQKEAFEEVLHVTEQEVKRLVTAVVPDLDELLD